MKPAPAKVLVLSLHYRPEENFIVSEVAEELARGNEVTVVTAHPNYPRGRFYSGQRFPPITRSVEKGVVVWRLPFLPDHSLAVWRRMLSYLSFAAVISSVAPFVAGRPKTVWVYHGPFVTALAALFFKVAYRSRIVITCADLWPESFIGAGVVRSSLIIRLASYYNRAISRAADVIVCATRGTREAFQEMGISPSKLQVIPVWIEGTQAVDPEKITDDRNLRIVYAGNLGPAQNLETVIRAAATIKNELPSLQFDLYGSGADEARLAAIAADLGATNVHFRGRVPTAEAFSATKTALAQIVCLQRSPQFRRTVPSKLFAAFAASTPLLYGLEGEADILAKESGGGIAFDPADHHSLVAAIRTLIAMSASEVAAMRRRMNQYFARNFSPRALLQEYRRVLAPERDSAELNLSSSESEIA